MKLANGVLVEQCLVEYTDCLMATQLDQAIVSTPPHEITTLMAIKLLLLI